MKRALRDIANCIRKIIKLLKRKDIMQKKTKPDKKSVPPKATIAEIARILSDAMLRLASVRTPIGAN